MLGVLAGLRALPVHHTLGNHCLRLPRQQLLQVSAGGRVPGKAGRVWSRGVVLEGRVGQLPAHLPVGGGVH